MPVIPYDPYWKELENRSAFKATSKKAKAGVALKSNAIAEIDQLEKSKTNKMDEIIPGLWLSRIPMETELAKHSSAEIVETIRGKAIHNFQLLSVIRYGKLGLVGAVVELDELDEKYWGQGNKPTSPDEWRKKGVEFLHMDMVDYGAIDYDRGKHSINEALEMVEAIHKARSKDTSAIIHCKSGKGKSRMIVAIYLALYAKEECGIAETDSNEEALKKAITKYRNKSSGSDDDLDLGGNEEQNKSKEIAKFETGLRIMAEYQKRQREEKKEPVLMVPKFQFDGPLKNEEFRKKLIEKDLKDAIKDINKYVKSISSSLKSIPNRAKSANELINSIEDLNDESGRWFFNLFYKTNPTIPDFSGIKSPLESFLTEAEGDAEDHQKRLDLANNLRVAALQAMCTQLNCTAQDIQNLGYVIPGKVLTMYEVIVRSKNFKYNINNDEFYKKLNFSKIGVILSDICVEFDEESKEFKLLSEFLKGSTEIHGLLESSFGKKSTLISILDSKTVKESPNREKIEASIKRLQAIILKFCCEALECEASDLKDYFDKNNKKIITSYDIKLCKDEQTKDNNEKLEFLQKKEEDKNKKVKFLKEKEEDITVKIKFASEKMGPLLGDQESDKSLFPEEVDDKPYYEALQSSVKTRLEEKERDPRNMQAKSERSASTPEVTQQHYSPSKDITDRVLPQKEYKLEHKMSFKGDRDFISDISKSESQKKLISHKSNIKHLNNYCDKLQQIMDGYTSGKEGGSLTYDKFLEVFFGKGQDLDKFLNSKPNLIGEDKDRNIRENLVKNIQVLALSYLCSKEILNCDPRDIAAAYPENNKSKIKISDEVINICLTNQKPSSSLSTSDVITSNIKDGEVKER